MNFQIGEGLLIGLYGMGLTIFILFLLGLVIYLFKFLGLSPKEEAIEEEELQSKSFEPFSYETNKKMVALSVALSKYFAEKEGTQEGKIVPLTPSYLKSLKEKRWKNG